MTPDKEKTCSLLGERGEQILQIDTTKDVKLFAAKEMSRYTKYVQTRSKVKLIRHQNFAHKTNTLSLTSIIDDGFNGGRNYLLSFL